MFLGRSSSGRAAPPRVIAQLPASQCVEVYLKSPAFHHQKSEFVAEREWMAYKFAEALGLPCAPGIPVRITKEFIATIPNHTLTDQLLSGPDVLFGSVNCGSGWSIWSTASKLPRSKLPLMTQAYVFDTIIQNWDRCIPNPNLLIKGDEFQLIDHEEAFVTATGRPEEQDFHPEPWRLDAINNFCGEDLEHPFWRKLAPKTQVSFAHAVQIWKNLPDDIYQLSRAGTPSCWDGAAMLRIADYLEEATSNIEQVLTQIQQNYDS